MGVGGIERGAPSALTTVSWSSAVDPRAPHAYRLAHSLSLLLLLGRWRGGERRWGLEAGVAGVSKMARSDGAP